MYDSTGSTGSIGGSSQEFLRDPYSYYRELRESDPVHWDEWRKAWVLTRHSDVGVMLRDEEHLSAQQGIGTTMLTTDPPDHDRLRTLVSKAFTPKTVTQLTPRIQEIVDGLLDAIGDRDEVDVIAEFSYPLPVTVIAELLGVEPERLDFFRSASSRLAVALGPITDPKVAAGALQARNELFAYFEELIEKRRAEPREDLVTALIQAEDSGDRLDHDELLAMMLLLLFGGHETTVNLVTNGLLALMRNPEQMEIAKTGDWAVTVEELLRFDSPVLYSGRVAKVDFDLAGKPVRKGDGVRMVIAAANHDPEVFADPEGLDVTRRPNPHLSFGGGIHFCLGAPLARIEGQIALRSFLERYPGVRLAEGELRYRPAPVLRGLEALPVELSS